MKLESKPEPELILEPELIPEPEPGSISEPEPELEFNTTLRYTALLFTTDTRVKEVIIKAFKCYISISIRAGRRS